MDRLRAAPPLDINRIKEIGYPVKEEHSGLKIAVTDLTAIDTSLAAIISGTIVAAAIINEIMAVIVAEFAFKWAGEIKE